MTGPAEHEHPVSRGNLSAWAVAHPAVVLFLIIVFSVAGLVSYLNLGRAEDPSFAIKTMVITAAWPGATAEEMQDQVADKLEKRLQELELFDFVRTYTRPGVSVIQVQLKDTARQKEVDDAWYQVRKKLNDSRPTLPQGVQGPFFNDEYGDVYSAIYMLSGADVSLAKLKDYAEIVRQRLLRTEGVAKVDIVGVRHQRIFIEFSHRKLATLGITPQAIFDSVARQNAVTPAGTIETSADRIDVRVTGAFKGEAAIAEVPIEAGGATFRLGDIATIKRGYEDPPESIVRHNGSEAVGVVVAMTKGANVLELGKKLKDAIADAKAQVPTGVEIDQITDQPRVVEESVGEFLRSFVEALAIVLVVSFVFAWMALGPRRRDVRSARARGRLRRHERGRAQSRPHHARLSHHRARPARRRCDHRRRDDGRQNGAGLEPHPCGSLCLGFDGVPHADRHARDRRRLPTRGHRPFDRGRICRQHLLDRRARPRRLVDRGRVFHALHRRQAAAELHQPRRRA